DMNDGAGDRHIEGRPVGPRDRQQDAGPRIAAQAADDLADIHSDDRLAVGLDDAVTRLDAGCGGRGPFDRADNLRHALLDRNLDADTAELAARGADQLAIFA